MASYAQRLDIELIFGTQNVSYWADLNNEKDEVFIAARIERALQAAEAEVDTLLAGRGYIIPIVDPIPVPTILRDITAKLAAIKLYESRAVQDYNHETGRLVDVMSIHRKYINDWLSGFRSGMIGIPGLTRSVGGAPGVVRSDEYTVIIERVL